MRKFVLSFFLFVTLIVLAIVALSSYRSANAGKLLADKFFSALPAEGYGTQRALSPKQRATTEASILSQGILYHQQKDYDRALVSLRAYLADQPVSDDYLPGLLASTAAFATGRYGEAQEFLENMSRDSDPALAAYHWQSALLALRKEDFSAARLHLEEVIKLRPAGYAANELLGRTVTQAPDKIQ